MRESGEHVFRHDVEFLQLIVSCSQLPIPWLAGDPLTYACKEVGKVMHKQFAKGNFFAVRMRRGRGVAQSGSAPVLGTGGREFESLRPDQHQNGIRNTRVDLQSVQRFPCAAGEISRRIAHAAWRHLRRLPDAANGMSRAGDARILERQRSRPSFITEHGCPCRVCPFGS